MNNSKEHNIGVCVIVQNATGDILLGKRKNSYKSGSYGIPGGRVELGEPIADAAKRELMEETELSPELINFVGVVRDFQDTYEFIHFVYQTVIGDQQPQLAEPDKCEGWEWFDPSMLPLITLWGHVQAIALLIQSKTFIDSQE